MKHSLFILISFLLLSSPVIGNNHKGETLYGWENPSGDGYIWKGFGDNETHPVYKGDVKNWKPNGLGIMITPWGSKYVGSWKNGEQLEGTFTNSIGTKIVGSWKRNITWNGILYDKNGNIRVKFVNGKLIIQDYKSE